jgi:hypothetical protein
MLLKNIESHAKTIKNFVELQPAVLRPAIIAKIFGNVSHWHYRSCFPFGKHERFIFVSK